MVKSRESVIFVMYSALNMIWTHCEVYWALDFEPFENECRAASGIGGLCCVAGGYFLARLIIFVFVDFRVFTKDL